MFDFCVRVVIKIKRRMKVWMFLASLHDLEALEKSQTHSNMVIIGHK